jgi:hypothetical protein
MDWDVGLIKLAAPYQLSSYPAVANDAALPLLQSFVWYAVRHEARCPFLKSVVHRSSFQT